MNGAALVFSSSSPSSHEHINMSSAPHQAGTLRAVDPNSLTRARSRSRTSYASSSDGAPSQHDEGESGFSRNDSQLHNSAWEALARWSEAASDAAASTADEEEDEVAPEIPVNFKRKEAWIIARSTAPIWMTHLLEMSNNAVSIVSLGHLGTTELAAASLSNLTANVVGMSVVVGWVGALDTVLPPVYSLDPKSYGLWTQRMAILCVFLSIPIMAIWYNTNTLLLALGQDPEVSALAGLYMVSCCAPIVSHRRHLTSPDL